MGLPRSRRKPSLTPGEGTGTDILMHEEKLLQPQRPSKRPHSYIPEPGGCGGLGAVVGASEVPQGVLGAQEGVLRLVGVLHQHLDGRRAS